MIRLSAGTAAALGLSASKMDYYPTTAYLLSGEQCSMRCAFCPQGSGGQEPLRRLGRISWPYYSQVDVFRQLKRAEDFSLQRVCLQSVRHEKGITPLLNTIERVKSSTTLPLSLSAWIHDDQELADLIRAGVDRLSISLDVINEEVYSRIKGGSLQKRLALLLSCAEHWPDRLSTHLIIGLGETEAEAITMIARLLNNGIIVALFAFVPLRGTAMEKADPPSVDHYRRIQAAHYLLANKLAQGSDFHFEQGRLVSYGSNEQSLASLLADGSAFQTSGCAGCNRPYYNERPGGVIYNYHRPLSAEESQFEVRVLLDSLVPNLAARGG